MPNRLVWVGIAAIAFGVGGVAVWDKLRQPEALKQPEALATQVEPK